MKTEWEYTHLAQAYLKRPDYSDNAIDTMLKNAGVKAGAHFCDIGAGVAHLTLKLLDRKMEVDAVEPNDAMRELGIQRTQNREGITWHEGTGEETGQSSSTFDMVTFGSSFNVTDRAKALLETQRILKDKGWVAAMWNHRDLEDPIQDKIESLIKNTVPEYNYGTRREDQTQVIKDSGLFREVIKVEGDVTHQQSLSDVVEAWRSHATLQRQAGELFNTVVDKIEKYLRSLNQETITVPYTTRIWQAQLK